MFGKRLFHVPFFIHTKIIFFSFNGPRLMGFGTLGSLIILVNVDNSSASSFGILDRPTYEVRRLRLGNVGFVVRNVVLM